MDAVTDKPNKIKTSISLDPGVLDRLKQEAGCQRRSVSALVELWIEERLQELAGEFQLEAR